MTAVSSTVGTPSRPDWQIAGEAWSHQATDWAYLFEPYGRDAIETVFRQLEIGPDTRLLDLACGSGLALGRAERLGARTAGIDAAAGLLAMAARRSPSSELVHGSMFELPWADGEFDAVVSFNGIWGGCEDVVAEVARVLAPGGLAALTFWGDPGSLDLLGYFIALGAAAAPVREEISTLATISAPGVAEAMIEGAGLEVVTRGVTSAILEWPDAATTWRGLRSPGLTVPALAETGEVELRRLVLGAVEKFRHPDGSYRFENDLGYVVMRKPSAAGQK